MRAELKQHHGAGGERGGRFNVASRKAQIAQIGPGRWSAFQTSKLHSSAASKAWMFSRSGDLHIPPCKAYSAVASNPNQAAMTRNNIACSRPHGSSNRAHSPRTNNRIRAGLLAYLNFWGLTE